MKTSNKELFIRIKDFPKSSGSRSNPIKFRDYKPYRSFKLREMIIRNIDDNWDEVIRELRKMHRKV